MPPTLAQRALALGTALALALVFGAAVVSPRRLVRWAGVVLPLLMQLRSGR
jgi:hypothetical protein